MPVSRLTLDRYLTARGETAGAALVLPGAVDLERFIPGAKPSWLVDRYALRGRRVLLTMARLGDDHREKRASRECLPRCLR